MGYEISRIHAVATLNLFRFYPTCCVCGHAKIRSYSSKTHALENQCFACCKTGLQFCKLAKLSLIGVQPQQSLMTAMEVQNIQTLQLLFT